MPLSGWNDKPWLRAALVVKESYIVTGFYVSNDTIDMFLIASYFNFQRFTL